MFIRFNDTVAFQFEGDTLCLSCTRDLAESTVIENSYLDAVEVRETSLHELLSIWAARCGIKPYATTEHATYDTEAFDSNEFPNPVEDVESDEFCHWCGSNLQDTYHRRVW